MRCCSLDKRNEPRWRVEYFFVQLLTTVSLTALPSGTNHPRDEIFFRCSFSSKRLAARGDRYPYTFFFSLVSTYFEFPMLQRSTETSYLYRRFSSSAHLRQVKSKTGERTSLHTILWFLCATGAAGERGNAPQRRIVSLSSLD